jgi:hypothetical protein
VARLLEAPCADFAFGQPDNQSTEAADFLVQRGCRVYSCVRGLNRPGRPPRFLLRGHIVFDYPWTFTGPCIEGGADHLMTPRHEKLSRFSGYLPRSRARIMR